MALNFGIVKVIEREFLSITSSSQMTLSNDSGDPRVYGTYRFRLVMMRTAVADWKLGWHNVHLTTVSRTSSLALVSYSSQRT